MAHAYSTWIEIVCENNGTHIGINCTAVQDALSLDITNSCGTGITSMDSTTFCSGTCGKLLYASAHFCPRNVTIQNDSFNKVNMNKLYIVLKSKPIING